MKTILTCLILMTISAAQADVAKLDKVLATFKKSSGIVMSVKKNVKSELLDKETVYQGKIRVSKGKFYWETETPEKNLLVFDGSVLWTVQYPPAEFEAPPQIARSTITTDKKNPNVLVAILSGKPLKEKFNIKEEKTPENTLKYLLTEKVPQLALKNLSITLDVESKHIATIAFEDEVENKTQISFSDIKVNQKIKKSLFQYKPPKGAAVTEY